MRLTLLAVVALVARVADAGSHDADAVASAVDVHALVGRHVALCALPAAVALAAATRVLPVSAAQHRAGGCHTARHNTMQHNKRRDKKTHTNTGALCQSRNASEKTRQVPLT